MTPAERKKADREAAARHDKWNRKVAGRKNRVSISAKNDYVAPTAKPKKKKKKKKAGNIADEITSKKTKLKGLLDRFGLGR